MSASKEYENLPFHVRNKLLGLVRAMRSVAVTDVDRRAVLTALTAAFCAGCGASVGGCRCRKIGPDDDTLPRCSECGCAGYNGSGLQLHYSYCSKAPE